MSIAHYFSSSGLVLTVRRIHNSLEPYYYPPRWSIVPPTEEHVEDQEGEIVRESPLEAVVEGCRRVMSDFLSRLHSSTSLTQLTPQQGSAGAEVNRVWSVDLLSGRNTVNRNWRIKSN